MEDEIKVGDWIKTKGGNICKVLQIRKQYRFTTNTGHPSITPERYFVDNIKQYSISKPYVKKHSKNIIDLIEINDYVNGSRVIDIVEAPVRAVYVDKITKGALEPIINKDIQSIITKEQFKQIKYIVKE